MLGTDELPRNQRQAYREGYQARLDDAALAANPYGHRSYWGILWDEGFTDAEVDADL